MKADGLVDSRVLQALESGDLIRSAELAETLSLDHEAVADSLERLEARGRVRNAGGETLDNPAPYWHVVYR